MSKPTKEAGTSANGLRLLPKTFSPSINEVIIGRGRKVVNHCGNQRFQDLIQSHLHEYSKAKSKTSKSAIILRVLMTVKQGSPEDVGGFVKQDASTKRWYALEDASARISTAQAFRDALSGSYRSSKQYKQQRRWNLKAPSISNSSSNSSSNSGSNNIISSSSSTAVPPSTSSSTPPEICGIASPMVLAQETTVSPSALLNFPRQSPPKGNLVGLRGILDSALKGLMDDDVLFHQDFDARAIPDRAWSITPQETRVDHLGSLLDRFEKQVEWTENPFEPTPLSLQKQQGDSEDLLKPTAAPSNESSLSLRDALTFVEL